MAIEIVKTDLNYKCGIIINEQNDDSEDENDDMVEVEQLKTFNGYDLYITTMSHVAAYWYAAPIFTKNL